MEEAPSQTAGAKSDPEDSLEVPGAESTQVRLIVMALSGVVFLLITGVIYWLPHQARASGPSTMASLNAFLNACASVCLIVGVAFIKSGNIRWHRRCMLSAFGISSMFLLTYLMHHAQVGSVSFRGVGAIRILYFCLLIPHIILSALVVPLALLTIYRGWTNRIELHRKMARVTLPLWLFTSTSGVAVYFMLYHL